MNHLGSSLQSAECFWYDDHIKHLTKGLYVWRANCRRRVAVSDKGGVSISQRKEVKPVECFEADERNSPIRQGSWSRGSKMGISLLALRDAHYAHQTKSTSLVHRMMTGRRNSIITHRALRVLRNLVSCARQNYLLVYSSTLPKARILRGQCSSPLPCCLPFPSPVKGLGWYCTAGLRKVFCVTREWNRLVCSPPDSNAGVLIRWAATSPVYF